MVRQTLATVNKRIDKGIALLNKKRPGWYKKVVLSKFDIGDGDSCVLGWAFKDAARDLYTGFEVGERALGVDIAAHGFDAYDLDEVEVGPVVRLGKFSAVATLPEYDVLQSLWYGRIRDLQQKGKKEKAK